MRLKAGQVLAVQAGSAVRSAGCCICAPFIKPCSVPRKAASTNLKQCDAALFYG